MVRLCPGQVQEVALLPGAARRVFTRGGETTDTWEVAASSTSYLLP